MSTKTGEDEFRSLVESLFADSGLPVASLPEVDDEKLPMMPYQVISVVVTRCRARPLAIEAECERALAVLAHVASVVERRYQHWEQEWGSSPEFKVRMHGGWGFLPDAKPEISRGRGRSRIAKEQTRAAVALLRERGSALHTLLTSTDVFAAWLSHTGRSCLT